MRTSHQPTTPCSRHCSKAMDGRAPHEEARAGSNSSPRKNPIAPTTIGSALLIAVALLAVSRVAMAGAPTDLERRFQGHINYLASDELEGRGIGSRGIELAANYIAKQFATIGLEPGGDDGTLFQTFEVSLDRKLSDKSRLTFSGTKRPVRLRAGFTPLAFTSDKAFDGGVVFCGYGIVAKDRDRDDFVHVDVSGKVVLVFRNEPPSWASDEGEATHHAMFRNKVYNAKDRLAAAILFVNPRPAEGESDTLLNFDAEGADAYGLPAFHITRAVAGDLLRRGDMDDLDTLQKRLDAGAYASKSLKGVSATGQAVLNTRTAKAHNVVGKLTGRGPHADEFVIIGAHYDHLGIRKSNMRKFKAGKLVREDRPPAIHNGADDNASGTSGLIEIARSLASGPAPKRSILFVAFTAEETGLHGSKHYVEHPLVPLDKTVAMLNMDMIGRMPPGTDKVQIFGVGSGSTFDDIVERAATPLGLEIAPSHDTGGRSDHASFIRNSIPSMHFYSGNHEDYHKPSDDADKINAADGARIIQLVTQVTSTLLARDEPPAFQKMKKDSTVPDGSTPTYKVVMGLAPGYGDDGKRGMAVDAVTAEGPAGIAGMKKGDRIVRIGGKSVANIYDYMAATRNNKAGDTVEVIVLREDKEITLEVTLSSAR